MKYIGETQSLVLRPAFFVLAAVLSFGSAASAAGKMGEDWRAVVDLRGKWKFELGDDMKRSQVSFNDSRWGEIFVPSKWEDEGFPGYDGYAWYRVHFRVPAGSEKKSLYLRLGCIDDVSEIFFNGKLIGVIGSFPPQFMTAYNVEVILPVSPNMLNVSGDNVIAVRVYDDQIGGGIVSGKVGLYESKTFIGPDVCFTGMWKFKKGDSEKYIDPSFDDRSWGEIFTPAVWESQGFADYDGMGWYRLHFRIAANLANQSLVLLLGRIDDLDEAYVNGEQIGHTGRIRSDPWQSHRENEYREVRAYTIPNGLLKAGADNVVAVRVLDLGGFGGIYQGPIGIMTRDQYREWRRNRSWNEDFYEGPWKVFERLFE